MFGFLKYIPPKENDSFDLTFDTERKSASLSFDENIQISKRINENLDFANVYLNTNKNKDVIVREFVCHVSNADINAFIVAVDGLSSGAILNEFVIQPLMNGNKNTSIDDSIESLTENHIPQSQVFYEQDIKAALDSVNFGNAVLFIDGYDKSVVIDVKSWEHRSVNTPLSEDVIQGPHEAFNEMLRCNTALIRKSINSSNLICESFTFGKQSKTPASLLYIDGIVNLELLEEIKKKLVNITESYILSVFDLEKYLEEKNLLFMPQMVTTERPDKVTRALVEGRLALILNGSSHALILPSNITDIVASPEDAYLRKPYSVFIKIIRIIAMILSLLTPGIYIALTRFHSESILTDMYVAIINESAKIPFAPLTEIIIMEISFELIKEASVRVPGAIGSSLGIVGGLILGQTAVNAGLVSPIVIIIVSVCGIASFAIPSYSLSFSFRIMRFIYIFAGGLCGIVGIISVLIIQLVSVLNTKSFGVPFCVPFSPKTSKNALVKALFDTHSIVHPPSYLKSEKGVDKHNEN